MSRRGKGDDSIYREGDRWRGAVDLGYGPDGRRLRKKVSGRSKAEVVRKLKDLRRELDAGLLKADDRLTVGAFLDRWVASNLEGRVSAKTRDSYADTVRLHLKPALGNFVLRHLTVAQVDSLWRRKREQGYSPNSIRIMRTTLRLALKQAEREGLVTRNVADLSAAPRIRANEGRSMTVDQARELRDALAGHRLEPVILLSLVFALRRGEALGLHWDALDLDWDCCTNR